jgi:uncharacterized damage-inducible protein DinB
MEINEYIGIELDYTKRALTKVLDGLNPQELSWRPAAGCNSIGLILFHVVRSEDSFIRARLQEKPQIWTAGKWHEKFNMPETETGAHYTVDQVNAFKVPELSDIMAYFDAVRTNTREYLAGLKTADFERKLQTPRLGEVSVAYIFSLVVGHSQQHVGEIGYLRGLQRGMDK